MNLSLSMQDAKVKINIFSAHNLDRAYSCLFYLKDEISKRKEYFVTVWGATNKKDIDIKWRNTYKCLRPGRIGKIKYVGGIISRLIVLFNGLKSDVVIINELEFFRTAFWIKKIKKRVTVIHYNTELYGKEEGMSCSKRLLSFYKRHASFPDLIIECLDERADYRKQKYGIDKSIFVINNTLPILNPNLYNDEHAKNYLKFDNSNPILIYAGGCNMSRGLDAIIKTAAATSNRVNYLFFCYGNHEDVEHVRKACRGIRNCLVYDAVDRSLLFSIMRFCQIGIQYYDVEQGLNNKYAAPSKFFEYLALGLNVLSSNNIGINRMIKENKLGECFENGNEMPQALNSLLERGLESRETIQTVFKNKFCYEIDAKHTINHITTMIDERYLSN